MRLLLQVQSSSHELKCRQRVSWQFPFILDMPHIKMRTRGVQGMAHPTVCIFGPSSNTSLQRRIRDIVLPHIAILVCCRRSNTGTHAKCSSNNLSAGP